MSKKEHPSITEQIDNDEGLKSKRKMLTIVSLILLALSFSAAKLEEVNTFVFKLSFDNQNGISILLVLSIIFLLVRYFNYARPYHDQLFKLWSDRLLRHHFFYLPDPYGEIATGLVVEKRPHEINLQEISHQGWHYDHKYKCSYLFIRKFSYSWSDQYEHYEVDVVVDWRNYLKTISLEIKYRFQRYFMYRENLDILTPYFLGLFAICSYFFNEQFQLALKFLIV